jgi:hypothetical protein
MSDTATRSRSPAGGSRSRSRENKKDGTASPVRHSSKSPERTQRKRSPSPNKSTNPSNTGSSSNSTNNGTTGSGNGSGDSNGVTKRADWCEDYLTRGCTKGDCDLTHPKAPNGNATKNFCDWVFRPMGCNRVLPILSIFHYYHYWL